MTLLDKKIVDLNPKEVKEELYKPIGTKATPYPGARPVVEPSERIIDLDVINMKYGVIADDANPLRLYSDQPADVAIGLMYRMMAIPSLLYAQEKIIAQRALDSKNKLILLLGDPGNGKTELAKTVALACDPRGPLQIDCGGRYLSDILWEQVIDYGEDFKTALTARIESGHLSKTSIAVLEEQFPKALKKDGDKITGIDWDKAMEPQVPLDGKDPKFGTKAELLDHVLSQIKQVAEWEGIPTQTTNSVGIKKQRGIAFQAFDEGRELILDEYTKSVLGSDDALQTWLQFNNGEIDEVTITNSTKVAGKEETESYTLRRNDMRAGYHVTATGNESSDGFSTHDLSGSAASRFIILKTGRAKPSDWEHRISQILTGLPLTTLARMLSKSAQQDPEKFGNTMVQLAQMGLPEQKRAKIPEQNLTRLKNFEDTAEAIGILTDFYIFLKDLVNPGSDLNTRKAKADDPNKAIVDPMRADIVKEISMAFSAECAFDLRKIIQDNTDASAIKPTVVDFAEAPDVGLNLAAVGHQALTPPVSNPEVISAEYGTRMVEVLLARIGNMFAGREHLNNAALEKMKQCGILKVDGDTEPTLADLLNQELIPNLGSTRNAYYLRSALLEHLKEVDPNLKLQPDDEIVSQEDAVAANNELERLSDAQTGTDPRKGRIIVLGPSLSHIFNQASAIDSIHDTNPVGLSDLVPAAALLESLKIPALAEVNMKDIFRSTISAEGIVPPSEVTTPVVQIAEGAHESGIGITTLRMQGANGDVVDVNVMRDGERGKTLVVTDKADKATKDALDRNGFTVVAYGDPDAEMRVAAFIKDTLDQPSRKSTLTALEQQLTAAFLLRAGNANDEAALQPLKKLLTAKDLPVPAAVNVINRPV